MAFGFGSKKSSSVSASGRNAFDWSQAQNTNQSVQNVWGAQAPYMQNMFAAGQNAMYGSDPTQLQQNNLQSMSAMQQGMGGMANMAQTGGAIGQFANPNNTLVDSQISNLSQTLGDFYANQINPAIQGAAVQAGGLGGGRNQVAQAMGAQDVANQFRQGATDIMGNAYGQAQAAAMGMDANMMGANQMMGQMGGMINNLGMANMQAPWMGMQNMQGLLGSPTVLGSSFGQGTSSAYGEDNQWQLSKDKSSGFQFGF